MPKRAAAPLFDAELEWTTVIVECETCGDSQIEIQIKELIEQQPEWTCPMCNEPTGQKTIVDADA